MKSYFLTACEERNHITHGGTRYLQYVFTEHGIMMLTGLLKSFFVIISKILRKYDKIKLILMFGWKKYEK